MEHVCLHMESETRRFHGTAALGAPRLWPSRPLAAPTSCDDARVPSPSPTSSNRVGVLLLGGFGTMFFLVVAPVLAAWLWAPRYDPFARHVDVWSTNGETRHAAALDRSYQLFEPTRTDDGRLFLTAFETTSRESRADFLWDPGALRLEQVDSIPSRRPVAGVDSTETAV